MGIQINLLILYKFDYICLTTKCQDLIFLRDENSGYLIESVGETKKLLIKKKHSQFRECLSRLCSPTKLVVLFFARFNLTRSFFSQLGVEFPGSGAVTIQLVINKKVSFKWLIVKTDFQNL
jgi:hypothetical protein